MGRKRWIDKNPSLVERVYNLADKGYSQAEISKSLNIPRSTLNQQISQGHLDRSRFYIVPNGNKNVFTRSLARKIHKLADKGYSQRQIAESVGITPQTIIAWRRKGLLDTKRFNLQDGKHHIRSEIQDNPELANKIYELADKGYTQRQIADAIGVLHHTLRRWIYSGYLDKERIKKSQLDYHKRQVKIKSDIREKGKRQRDDKRQMLIDAIRSLSDKGYTQRQIASILDITEYTITRWKRQGLL